MASSEIEHFWNDLVSDIKANRVVLPSLPEIALRTRKLLDDPSVNANQITKVISADAVLTTKLLRVVNSPLYRTSQQIDDIRTAVTRLGNANVRSVVTSLAMEQLYQNKLATPLKRKFLKENWDHSVHVAALAHVLADRFTSLNPDEAMLGGLIHDIGKLPIIEYAELLPELAANEKVLNRILEVLHTKVGLLILKAWKFPPELVKVAAEHEDLQRDPGTEVDYADIVLIANLLSHVGKAHPSSDVDWSEIPAFRRLALNPEECIEVMKNAQEEIKTVKQLFSA